MLSQDLRSILKLCLAALLAGSFSLATSGISYVWYPLLSVVLGIDDTDAQLLNNIKGRVLTNSTLATKPPKRLRSFQSGTTSTRNVSGNRRASAG